MTHIPIQYEEADWRRLRILYHWLFNWKIKPVLLKWHEYKAYSHPATPRAYQLRGIGPFRQFWFWEIDGHYCRAQKRIQLVRTLVDRQITPNRWNANTL